MKNPVKNTTLISKREFAEILENRFGLFINNESIYKYIDYFQGNQVMYNVNNPKVFTIDYKDQNGFSYANTNGIYYNNHAIKNSDLHKEFKEFINTYTFKIGNYFMI